MCVLAVAMVLLHATTLVNGDTYLHYPRGSNNRLNEDTMNRKTNNRVFDSQNNNKGGYNVGASGTSRNPRQQFQMTYFMSQSENSKVEGDTFVPIEWTNQHGCGQNTKDNAIKLNCNIVIQFMCQPLSTNAQAERLRDGIDTGRNNYRRQKRRRETQAQFIRRAKTARNDRALNEPYAWYDKCAQRDRNKGLFTADQNLNSDKSTRTRQNPNGNRNGYECPEERDYYPYWHPTDWKDIVVLTEDASLCPKLRSQSFNVKARHECREKFAGTRTTESHVSTANNKDDCAAKGGRWALVHNYLEKLDLGETACEAAGHIWGDALYGTGQKECLVKLDPPECKVAEYTRVNHLGNAPNMKASQYMWKVPHFPSETPKKCVIRVRYNISTEDYAPYSTDATSNNDDDVIENNPQVEVGLRNENGKRQKLQLALNTAQTGRTFQDRTHVYKIEPRTAKMKADAKNIYTMSVRGKRGNIVQTYPAVEYDFVPNDLQMKPDDAVHISWTGSNTHDNKKGKGGDGQPGDDGEGKGGTDRSNMLCMTDRRNNFFTTMEDPRCMFNQMTAVWTASHGDNTNNQIKQEDMKVQLATSGQYKTMAETANLRKWNNKLNNAPASYGGMVAKISNEGTFNFGCSRNNNYSNRSQKGTIIVTEE